MSSSNGDSSSLLFRSFINHVVTQYLSLSTGFREDLGDGGGEGGLSVIDVTV